MTISYTVVAVNMHVITDGELTEQAFMPSMPLGTSTKTKASLDKLMSQ